MDLDLVALATVPGATAGAAIVTQFVKAAGPSHWGGAIYRRVALLTGLVLLLVASFALGDPSWGEVLVAGLAGMVAGTAASASYDIVQDFKYDR